MSDLLNDRKQRVLLYRQISSRENFKSGVLQDSVLVPQQFFIYMSNLPDALSANVELFTGDTALLCIMHDLSFSANLLKNDLRKVNI